MKYYALVVLASWMVTTSAQERRKCGSESILTYEFQNPVNLEAFDDFFRTYYSNSYDSIRSNIARIADPSQTVIRIPVVVHIVGSDIVIPSDLTQQVNQALDNANKCLRKIPSSIGDGDGVDTFFELCLATVDPDGNTTTGINIRDEQSGPFYVVSPTATYLDPLEVRYAPLIELHSHDWDAEKYLNIVVANMHVYDGYSFPPWVVNWRSEMDGIAIVPNLFFPVQYSMNSDPVEGKTLVHEFGHYMGLLHTFGRYGDALAWNDPLPPACQDSQCAFEGDRMCDTPPCCAPIIINNQPDPECPVSSLYTGCNYGSNTCTNDVPDLFDPIKNYMHYNFENCQNEFTADQAAFMLHTCQGLRSGFLNSNNACGFTSASCNNGVQDPGEWGLDCGGVCPPCPGGSHPPCYYDPQNTVPIGEGYYDNRNPVSHKLIYGCLKGNLDGSSNNIRGKNISVGTDGFHFEGGNVYLRAGTTQSCVLGSNNWGSGIRVYPGFQVAASESDEVKMDLTRFTGYGGIQNDDACPSNAPGWRLGEEENIEQENVDSLSVRHFTIVLYPNPTTGLLTLQHPQTIVQMEAFDAYGRSVARTAPNSTTGTMDLSGNAAGIYIIRATLEDGSTETHRAVLAPQ